MKWAIFQAVNGKPVFMQFRTAAFPYGYYYGTSVCRLFDTPEEARKVQQEIQERYREKHYLSDPSRVQVLEVPDDVAIIREERRQRLKDIDADTQQSHKDKLFERGHELQEMDTRFTKAMHELAVKMVGVPT